MASLTALSSSSASFVKTVSIVPTPGNSVHPSRTTPAVVRASADNSAKERLIGKTPSWLENAINSITVQLNKSPLNEGKKRLASIMAGSYDEAATKALIEKYISENPVVVFSWKICPFAKRAKQLLTDLGAEYIAVEMDDMPNGLAIRAELAKLTNRTSVPNIFIGGKSYGGCNDGPGILPLHDEGRLELLLREAGALKV